MPKYVHNEQKIRTCVLGSWKCPHLKAIVRKVEGETTEVPTTEEWHFQKWMKRDKRAHIKTCPGCHKVKKCERCKILWRGTWKLCPECKRPGKKSPHVMKNTKVLYELYEKLGKPKYRGQRLRTETQHITVGYRCEMGNTADMCMKSRMMPLDIEPGKEVIPVQVVPTITTEKSIRARDRNKMINSIRHLTKLLNNPKMVAAMGEDKQKQLLKRKRDIESKLLADGVKLDEV